MEKFNSQSLEALGLLKLTMVALDIPSRALPRTCVRSVTSAHRSPRFVQQMQDDRPERGFLFQACAQTSVRCPFEALSQTGAQTASLSDQRGSIETD